MWMLPIFIPLYRCALAVFFLFERRRKLDAFDAAPTVFVTIVCSHSVFFGD